MFRERAQANQALSLFLDVFAIFAAFWVALSLRILHGQLPLVGRIPSVPWVSETIVRSDYAVLFGVSAVAWVLALRASSLYRGEVVDSWGVIIEAYVRALLVAAFASAAANFIFKMGSISRIFFVYYFVISFFALFTKQLILREFQKRLYHSTYGCQHALVIGVGDAAVTFARVLSDARESGYTLVGLLMRSASDPSTIAIDIDAPVVGNLDELDDVLRNHPVDEVFIVGGAVDMAALSPVAEDMIQCGRVVSLVAPLAGSEGGVRGRVTEFAGIPMLSYGPMPHDASREVGKRALDVAVASAIALLALPVMGAIALLIKATDRGPILFAQKRIGRWGEEFTLYKFRSMRCDAETALRASPELYQRYVDNDYKLPDEADPRITRLGRFMRRTSLDELPQLWNVLRGDMAVVGPRPIVPAELEMYHPYSEVLLSAKPGLTGNWQVNGRSDVRYPGRAYMDLDYVGSHSLGEDLAIIAKTVPAVLRGTGAH
jgi:exopolysaccharide biosynthesis polyprenyl glycosylphosphotransferase